MGGILNNGRAALIATNDDKYMGEELEAVSAEELGADTKKESSLGPLRLQDVFDIGTYCSELKYVKSTNSNDYATKIASDEFGGYPSKIVQSSVRLVGLMKILKEFGKLQVVGSVSSSIGIPLNFLLRLTPNDSKGDEKDIIYYLVPELDSLPLDKYPEYKEDILSIESYEDELIWATHTSMLFHPENKVAYKLSREIHNRCFVEFLKDEITYVEMIIQTQSGLSTSRIRFDIEQSDDTLDLHYGDGFSNFHEKLVARIGSKNKGIAMLHGPPGTGKTHYIRRLLPALNKAGKRVILIPKHVLGSLESPSFNEFMLRNFIGQKIVFIIEDSESIIAKRTASGGGRSELVSTLLNITDGILNDIFSIQVILTFNTKLESIDDALLRKGRLIAKYSFDPLNRERAKLLADHLGVELDTKSDEYTLADIYALRMTEEDDILINQGKSKRRVQGF